MNRAAAFVGEDGINLQRPGLDGYVTIGTGLVRIRDASFLVLELAWVMGSCSPRWIPDPQFSCFHTRSAGHPTETLNGWYELPRTGRSPTSPNSPGKFPEVSAVVTVLGHAEGPRERRLIQDAISVSIDRRSYC